MPVRLHVEAKGEGPAIVFAHGFGGSARNFRPQVRALSDRYRVVVYDARGHGRSEAPEEADAYTLERLVDDFERVAGDHGGGGPVVAAGLSLGAAVALAFARRRPERVSRLILASPPAAGANRSEWALGFARAIDAEGLEAAGARFVWGERSRFDPAGAKLIKSGLMEHPGRALAHVLRETLAVLPAPAELAGTLDLPALVIAGGDDEAVLPAARELEAVLPRVRLVVVPGAGHVVNLVAADAFNAEVRAFLSQDR
jgi:pimeloyl-ACP methyl ester carboxylesterase